MGREAIAQALQRKSARKKVSRDQSTEPPIGGWNTRDAVDNVPPTDAIVLDNWTCGLGAVHVRKGHLGHSYSTKASGHTAGAVKTLMKYNSGDVDEMFAADGGAIWKAEQAGAAAVVELSGMSSDIWSWTNFRAGLAGDYGYLVLVNGSEKYTYEPGAGFEVLVLEDLTNPVGCFNFKNRMYYWKANSQSIWYTELYAVGAAAGFLHEVQLGGVGQFGGSVVSIESVTHDGGSGTDDYLLVFMSGGEVLAYQGSYPDDEADWAIVGIYNPGLPMGPRAFAKYGGDLYMMTDLDILPMSRVLKGTEAQNELTKISGAMQRAAALRGNFGFQIEMFPPSKLMIFNVPNGTEFVQFVMNTVTGAWSRWTDIQSYCWLEYDGDLYFGTDDGGVFKAESGDTDYDLVKEGSGGGTDLIPYFYGIAGFGQPGYCVAIWDVGDSEWTFNSNKYDRNGLSVVAELGSVTIGDTVKLRNNDTSKEISITVTGTAESDTNFLLIGTEDYQTGGAFDPSEEVILDVSDASGVAVLFEPKAILSDVQSAWLRFGVEENKQFDAQKIFFRAGAEVIRAIKFGVDYYRIPDFAYPEVTRGFGVPWSGEWSPPPSPPAGMPATIPNPTTWWTDELDRPEGSNPSTPINAVTLESGSGAVTPWGVESATTEEWEIINGYGRAISMYMKLKTMVPVEWDLTMWHAKMGSRM